MCSADSNGKTEAIKAVDVQILKSDDSTVTVDSCGPPVRNNKALKHKHKEQLSYSMDHKLLLTTLFKWRGSILPTVLTKLDIWIATGVHTALFVVKELTKTPERPNIFEPIMVDWGSLNMAISLMVFYLVFFNSECYSRYRSFYAACTGMAGSIGDVGIIVAADFAALPAKFRWDVMRYCIASACLVYMKMWDGNEEQNTKTRRSMTTSGSVSRATRPSTSADRWCVTSRSSTVPRC